MRGSAWRVAVTRNIAIESVAWDALLAKIPRKVTVAETVGRLSTRNLTGLSGQASEKAR